MPAPSGDPKATMKSLRFRQEREVHWRQLAALVNKAERGGIRRLNEKELTLLPQLYRATLSALSVARSISLDRNLREYLESLTTRAFFCVYGPKRPAREAFATFIMRRLPQTLRRHVGAVALAALFLLAGCAVGFALVESNAEWFYSFVGEDLAQGRDPAASREQLLDGIYAEGDGALGMLANFAAFLFSHNSQIGIMSFALGFALGIPVFFLMFTNGLMLGAFSAVHHQRGVAVDWWGWVLPHGITELLALVICGGAGLVLGQALVFPGRYSRKQNLAIQGRDAGVLVLGAVMMLFIAGLIEGIFRQVVHSLVIRYALVGITLVFWAWYYARVGREEARS